MIYRNQVHNDFYSIFCIPAVTHVYVYIIIF